MDKQKSYGGLDVFRLIAAFLVIAIHTSPLESFSVNADFFLTRILARLAVPFFFMATGHFVLSDYLSEKRQNYYFNWKSDKVLIYIRKIFLLYGIAILIYLPVGIYAGSYQGITIPKALKMFFFDGTFYHLWYFPALMIGLLLTCTLWKLCSFRVCMIISLLLYLIGLLGDSYWGITAKISGIASVYQAGFHIFHYTRNGLFFAPLFLLLGAQIGKTVLQIEKKKKMAFDILGFLFSFLIMIGEGFLLHHFHFQRHDSMYLTLPVCSLFLYRLLLRWNIKVSGKIRNTSTWIYILHPAVIVVVRFIAKILHATNLLIDNSLLHYIAVSLLSFISAWILLFLISRTKRIHQLMKVGSPQTSSTPFGASAPSESSALFATSRAWISLNRLALQHNVSVLKGLLPEGCVLMPVLKADAYGHGAVPMAKEYNRMGINAFCVACLSEGIELRKNGIQGEILILGYTHPEQAPLIRKYHLAQTIVDHSYAKELNRYGKKVRVHIAIDTGMHRLGESVQHMDEICEIFEMENLQIEGAFTHLCTCDTDKPTDTAFVKEQANAFYNIIEELKNRGYHCPKMHIQSSYGILNYSELSGDYSRAGISLYGMKSDKTDYDCSDADLQPVLSLKCRIASVKELSPGEGAGYSLAFVAKRPTKLATLAIGYADGLPRCLSCGVGAVLINGQKAPIVGRICMDQTMVDVTDIPAVHAGDIAVLIGKSGQVEISVYDIARQTGTITNEILSRLGARLERIME